jgi:hypothetical protein
MVMVRAASTASAGPHTSAYDGRATTATRIRLADDRQVGGDGEGGTDVGVRDPEVEGDGGRLEGEPDEGEDDSGVGQCRELPVDVLHAVGDPDEVEGAGGGVQEADAHEADRGGGDRGQEELQGRFRGAPVAVPQADEGEGGKGGDLQGDDEGREVAGGGQEGGTGRGGQQQEPELPLGQPPVRVLQGGDRQQGGHEGAAEHQELDDQRELVRGVAADVGVAGEAEGGAVAAEEGQQHEQGRGETGDRQSAEERLAAFGDEEVRDEDDEADDRRDGRRRDGEPVDGLDQRRGQGLDRGAHRVPPARSCCTAGSLSPRSTLGHSPATTVRTTSGVQAANS